VIERGLGIIPGSFTLLQFFLIYRTLGWGFGCRTIKKKYFIDVRTDEVFKRQLIERYLAGEETEGELMAFFGLLNRNQLDGSIESYMD